MSAPIAHGIWVKDYAVTESTTIDDSGPRILNITTVEPSGDVANVNLTHDNDGTFRNTSGQTLTFEVMWGLQVSNLTSNGDRVTFRLAKSSDKITWVGVEDNQEEVHGTDSKWWTLRTGIGEITVAADEYFAVIVDKESGSDHNFRIKSAGMLAKSLDGGNEPVIQGQCGVHYTSGYENWQLSTNGSYVEFNRTTTVGGALRGVSSNNQGRFTNTTGESKLCYVWWHLSVSTNASPGNYRQQVQEVQGDAVSRSTEGWTIADVDGVSSHFGIAAVMLDAGEYIRLRGKNISVSGTQCRVHSMSMAIESVD